MDRTKSVLRLLLFIVPIVCHSSPYYGATFSTIIYGKEPPYLNGYQFMLVYDPTTLKWRGVNIYFDGGFSHFWDSKTPYYSTLNIYSFAPVFRYTLAPFNLMKLRPHPFIELSIGLSYLNHTHFEDRKLGIHFAFQDRIGLGVYFGERTQFTIGIHAVHYSNAHLSGHNSGVTAPVVLDIGYRFQ